MFTLAEKLSKRKKNEVRKCYAITSQYLDGFEDCISSIAIALDMALLF